MGFHGDPSFHCPGAPGRVPYWSSVISPTFSDQFEPGHLFLFHFRMKLGHVNIPGTSIGLPSGPRDGFNNALTLALPLC